MKRPSPFSLACLFCLGLASTLGADQARTISVSLRGAEIRQLAESFAQMTDSVLQVHPEVGEGSTCGSRQSTG